MGLTDQIRLGASIFPGEFPGWPAKFPGKFPGCHFPGNAPNSPGNGFPAKWISREMPKISQEMDHPGNFGHFPGNSPGSGFPRKWISREIRREITREMPAGKSPGEFPGKCGWGSQEISGVPREIPRMASQIPREIPRGVSRLPFPGKCPGKSISLEISREMPKIPRGIWLTSQISWLGGGSRRLGPFCLQGTWLWV